ncbi:MAG: hypothetical protein ACI841_005082 [Planctomycetota bacterium]|jgi:hypothetical protein
MTKRSYIRRSDEELIGALEQQIKQIEARKQSKMRKDSPVLKEVPKVKRKLSAFAQLCMDHDRHDLVNTVMAFLATLESQSKSELRSKSTV